MPRFSAPLKRVYHRLRGTTNPRIRPIGAYPLDAETLALRFETSLPQCLDGELTPRISIVADGADVAETCIELNASRAVRGGHELIRRTYSLPLRRQARGVKIDLLDRGGAQLASIELNQTRIAQLLARFEKLIQDASSDRRYRPTAPAPHPLAQHIPSSFTAIVAVSEPDGTGILDTVESLSVQTHGDWEALVAAEASSRHTAETIVRLLGDDRIRCIPSDNGLASAICYATHEANGAYSLFLRQGDVLAPGALGRFAEHAAENGRPTLIYCDSDCIIRSGAKPARPRFRPDFNRDLLYSYNYLPTCFAIRKDALAQMGGQPVSLNSAWNYELVLKVSERAGDAAHISEILCHDRLPDSDDDRRTALSQERNALVRHFDERGIAAAIGSTRYAGIHRTTFLPPAETPRISIIIPNKDHVDYLKPCIESVHEKAGYPNYEIVVIENNSAERETFDYYRHVELNDERVRIVSHDGPFNYSRIINCGVRETNSPLLLLLNNDTTVITDGFLSILAGYFVRPEIGVVGPRLLFPDGLVQHAGMALLRSGRMGFLNQNLSPTLHRGYLGSLASASSCSAVLGACQMVRRSTFDEVEGYCEDLAVTCNDIDFCWKVRELGLEVVYTPHVELFHKEFGTRSGDTATFEREKQSTREYELMVQRWPRVYERGDGFINPNLDQESIYFKLPL